MKRNRDRIDLIAAILEAASDGAIKTRIMYNANLSYELLEKYLTIAINLDFLQLNSSRYELAEKGLQFLKSYLSFKKRYNRAQNKIVNLEIEREKFEQMILGKDLQFR
jgi:predicted transcriptional regulator